MRVMHAFPHARALVYHVTHVRQRVPGVVFGGRLLPHLSLASMPPESIVSLARAPRARGRGDRPN